MFLSELRYHLITSALVVFYRRSEIKNWRLNLLISYPSSNQADKFDSYGALLVN